MTRQRILWAAAALVGIVVTAVLTWSASQLAGQRIGLASEPLSVTSGLAPARDATRDRPRSGARAAHRPPASQRRRSVSTSQLPTTTVYTARAPAPAPAATAAPVVTPPASTTSAAPTPVPRQHDDNGGGSGQGSGSSRGGGQRDD